MVSKQLISPNILRILAGFLVIFIHTTDPFLLFDQYIGGSSWWIIYYGNTLSKVAVPIFVMLSGYLLLNTSKIEKVSDFYKKRLSKVGTPLLLWFLVLLVWRALWWKIPITPESVLATISTVNIGPLYFLVVILEIYLLTPFLIKILQSKRSFLYVCLLGLLSMMLIGVPLYIFNNSFNVSQSIFTIALPYCFYFVLGGFLRSKKLSTKLAIPFFILYFLIGLVAVFFAHGDQNSYFVSYFGPTVIGMSIVMFLATLSLESWFEKNFSIKTLKVLQYISGTILGIFLLHTYVLDVMRKTTNLTPSHIQSPLWAYIIGIVLLVFIVCFFLVTIGKKIPILNNLFKY